jgi:integrase
MRVVRNRYGGWDAIEEAPGRGQRRRIVRSGRTQREAKERLREAVGVPLGSGTPLADYLREWLRSKERALAPGTFRSYEQKLRTGIVPVLGDVRLRDLSAPMIEEALALMPQSQRTIHSTKAVLSTALRAAVKKKLIASNPCDGVEGVVRGPRPEIVYLTLDQAAALLETCEARDDAYGDLVALALLTGMRKGELLGLRWGDVRPAALLIQRSRVDAPGGLLEKAPKSKAGVRAVPLGPAGKATLARARARLVAAPLPTAYVFDLHSTQLQKHFKRILRQAGLPSVRLHDLRHTAATQLGAVTDIKTIQTHLGHSSIGVTGDMYMHAVSAHAVAAVEAYEALLQEFRHGGGMANAADIG